MPALIAGDTSDALTVTRAPIAVFFRPDLLFFESIWVSRFNFEKFYQIWVF